MKTLTENLLSHFSKIPTTYTTCWKITPNPPGLTIGFTEHPEDIIFEGLTYTARSGFSPSALRSTSDLAVDNFDVTFMLEFDGTAEAQLLAGYYDYAKVEVFLVNYNDVAMGKVVLACGTLGEITISRGQAKTEIRGLAQALQQDVLELISPTCRADLGDARCKVNLAALTVTGTVTTVMNNKLFTDNTRTESDAYFNGGLLTWLTGANAQLAMEVKAYQGANKTIELYQAMPYAVKPADHYQVYRGCDKSLTTCKTVFNNVINFRGEPHLPGIDQIMQFGGR